jgi:hypothetical protein
MGSDNAQWFERMLHRFHRELWIGDALIFAGSVAQVENRFAIAFD